MQRRGWKTVSQTKRDRENHASNWKTGWFAISCNSIRFFAYAWQSLSMMEISRKSRLLFHGSKSPKDVRCQSALHLAISLPFTDKCSEKRLVSVNHQHNDQKFTDKSLENAGLSVKCVLLTDKSSKMKPLSVNSSEILDRLRLRTKNGWVAR